MGHGRTKPTVSRCPRDSCFRRVRFGQPTGFFDVLLYESLFYHGSPTRQILAGDRHCARIEVRRPLANPLFPARCGAKTIPAGVPRNRAALPGPDRVVSACPALMAVWNAEDHLHSRFTGYDVPRCCTFRPKQGTMLLCRPSKNALTKPAKQADTPVSSPEDFRHMTKSSRSRRTRCSAPAGWGAGAILAGVPGTMSRLLCRGMIQRECRGEDHQIL